MRETGFWRWAAAEPDRPALVDVDGRRITAGELLAESNKLVHGLRALGLQPGDTVATVLPNGADIIELIMATSQAGFYLTPVNHNLTAPEIAYIVADSGAKALVCDPASAEPCRRAADEAHLPSAAMFCTASAAGSGGGAPAFRPYAELKAGQPPTAPEDRRGGFLQNYTSGTTGRPKGVRRPLPNVSPDVLGQRYAQFLQLFGMPMFQGVHLVVSPLYHTAVLGFAQYHLHAGHPLVLMDKWTPESMLQLVEKERVAYSHMVPTHFNRLLALPEEVRKRYDLSSMTHMVHGAAPCPVQIKRRMLEWWGPVIYEYYSASEGGGTIAPPKEWLEKPGTVGKAWYGAEIRVLDDHGQPCAPGVAGTVYIKMGDYKFEYHKDQKKTEQAWKEGFFTVGDAGYLDADGYLFLCDRKADMIISGGVNIYPAEIESALLEHPEIRDAAVFGIPDNDWGEQVKAVVELHDGHAPSPELVERLKAYLGERLAKHKIPRTIDFIAALPRDPSGKLYKRKLRDPYWQGRDRMI